MIVAGGLLAAGYGLTASRTGPPSLEPATVADAPRASRASAAQARRHAAPVARDRPGKREALRPNATSIDVEPVSVRDFLVAIMADTERSEPRRLEHVRIEQDAFVDDILDWLSD